MSNLTCDHLSALLLRPLCGVRCVVSVTLIMNTS